MSGLGRRFAVWFTAWTMRRGVCDTHVMEALTSAYKHRDGAWRLAVIADAKKRNDRKRVSA